jgi:hypothetical protein
LAEGHNMLCPYDVMRSGRMMEEGRPIGSPLRFVARKVGWMDGGVSALGGRAQHVVVMEHPLPSSPK